jgi:TolB-like protein/AraC-like DNA-binding protein
MSEPLSMDQAFVRKISDLVLANISDENFGAEKLAEKAGMSHASLLRKLKSITNLDISQFIRQVRLRLAMEMLQKNEGTVAEIAFRVGFGSATYFNKCFHEYFGFPPGEVRKGEPISLKSDQNTETVYLNKQNNKGIKSGIIYSSASKSGINGKQWLMITGFIVLLGLISVLYFIFFRSPGTSNNSRTADYSKSILVIPFKNLSDDSNNQHFADAIMEDILNNLFMIRDLRVISRTTSERFRQTDMNAPEISKKLNVKYILEGSVLKYENNVRIFVQLIDASRDQHVWSEKYDKSLNDLFRIQAEISTNIAKKLEAVVLPSEYDMINKIPTNNLDAYNLYLKGRFNMEIDTKDSKTKAAELFEQAAEKDPAFIEVYLWAAQAYYDLVWLGYMAPDKGYPLIEKNALKALEFNKCLVKARRFLCGLALNNLKWEEARKECLFEIECNPFSSDAHSGYAAFLHITGQIQEARKQYDLALEYDPTSYWLLYQSAT